MRNMMIESISSRSLTASSSDYLITFDSYMREESFLHMVGHYNFTVVSDGAVSKPLVIRL